jgi:hypothetical protein
MPTVFILAALMTLTPMRSDMPPEPQAGRDARTASKDGQFEDFHLPAGTALQLKLRTPFTSATAKVNDEVQATLSTPVIQNGVELLPADSVLIGTITAVVRASKQTPIGSVTFAFSMIQHARTKDRGAVATQRIILEAPARTSGGRNRQKPADTGMTEGGSLVATTAEPLIIRIPK